MSFGQAQLPYESMLQAASELHASAPSRRLLLFCSTVMHLSSLFPCCSFVSAYCLACSFIEHLERPVCFLLYFSLNLSSLLAFASIPFLQ